MYIALMEAAALVKKIAGINAALSKLPSLSPSSEADALFTALVAGCVTSSPAVDVTALGPEAGRMRDDLVRLCADAEARLEASCADALAALGGDPLDHLGRLFPFYNSYARLGELEHALLSRHAPDHLAVPARVAFLGSGSLPLSPLLVAERHMPDAAVDCYDRCGAANDRANRLLLRPGADDDAKRGGLAERMSFRTADVEDLTHELAAYDVVFLGASLGLAAGEKARVGAHLGEHMADGAVLVARSAHGARGFLCAVLEPADVARGGFQVLAVHHPDDGELELNLHFCQDLSRLEAPHLSKGSKRCGLLSAFPSPSSQPSIARAVPSPAPPCAMVLISVPVGPRPVYDSDVEVCEPEIATDPLVEKLNLVEKENDYLKEKLKRIEEEKMKLELYVADVVDDHKIKMDAMRLKIRKIRKYAINKEA